MPIIVCEYIINLGGGRFKSSAVSDGVKDNFQLVHKIIYQDTGTQLCHSVFQKCISPWQPPEVILHWESTCLISPLFYWASIYNTHWTSLSGEDSHHREEVETPSDDM
jgi:hypothetical protein